MAKEAIKFEGVSFNKTWICKFKSESDFIAHPSNKEMFAGANREAKLAELYVIATGKHPKAKAEKPAEK